jgi:hypothetical protein
MCVLSIVVLCIAAVDTTSCVCAWTVRSFFFSAGTLLMCHVVKLLGALPSAMSRSRSGTTLARIFSIKFSERLMPRTSFTQYWASGRSQAG